MHLYINRQIPKDVPRSTPFHMKVLTSELFDIAIAFSDIAQQISDSHCVIYSGNFTSKNDEEWVWNEPFDALKFFADDLFKETFLVHQGYLHVRIPEGGKCAVHTATFTMMEHRWTLEIQTPSEAITDSDSPISQIINRINFKTTGENPNGEISLASISNDFFLVPEEGVYDSRLLSEDPDQIVEVLYQLAEDDVSDERKRSILHWALLQGGKIASTALIVSSWKGISLSPYFLGVHEREVDS